MIYLLTLVLKPRNDIIHKTVSGQQINRMPKKLEIAIEKLYKTFAVYPFKSTIEGCPCCVSGSDKEKIHSKQLKELEEDDLSRYAFKAISTWGNIEDFKHYLPRIFELLSTTDFIVDTFVVLGKLEYGDWKTWPDNEQKAINDFLLTWWQDLIKSKSYFDLEAFIEIYKLTGSIDEILLRWTIDFNNNSFVNYIELVQDYYSDLCRKRNDFKELKEKDADKLLTWIRSNSEFFESGFFHFDKTDKDMAEKISNTQYIYERTK